MNDKQSVKCLNQIQKNKGFTTGLTTTLLICIAAFIVFSQYAKKQSIDKWRNEYPELSVETLKVIDELSLEKVPYSVPVGMYITDTTIDGINIKAKYYFGSDNTISKEVITIGKEIIFSNKLSLKGKANYNFKGSVMLFENVTGDKVLFAKEGEPIKVNGKNQIEVLDGESSIVMNLL